MCAFKGGGGRELGRGGMRFHLAEECDQEVQNCVEAPGNTETNARTNVRLM